MSDFFAPSYWYGAGPNFSGLANAYASKASNDAYFANQANTLGTAANMAHTATGNLTQDPAKYAAIGAAYGRATGGFRPSGGSPAPAPTSVPVEGDVWGPAGAEAVPYTGGPFMDASGSEAANPFTSGTRRFPGFDSGASVPLQSASPGDGVGAYFPTAGYQDPFNTPSMTGRGFGRVSEPVVPVSQMPQQLPEFSPNQADPGLFSGLTRHRNPDITTAGPTFPTDVSPPPSQESVYGGFPGSFGTEGPITARGNAGSANPFTSGADPVPYFSGPMAEGGDVFDTGTRHIGPTMGPAMSAYPGGAGAGTGGVAVGGRGFTPSSPFDVGTGVAPVPYPEAGGQAFPGGGIGGLRSSNPRDQLADVMAGSAGTAFPPSPQVSTPKSDRLYRGSGRDFNDSFSQFSPSLEDQLRGTLGDIDKALAQPSPPYVDAVPTPTPQQMNDAQSILRRGPGGGGQTVGVTVPPAEQKDYLAPRINQNIYDLGQAGDYYGRLIGGPDALLRRGR